MYEFLNLGLPIYRGGWPRHTSLNDLLNPRASLPRSAITRDPFWWVPNVPDNVESMTSMTLCWIDLNMFQKFLGMIWETFDHLDLTFQAMTCHHICVNRICRRWSEIICGASIHCDHSVSIIPPIFVIQKIRMELANILTFFFLIFLSYFLYSIYPSNRRCIRTLLKAQNNVFFFKLHIQISLYSEWGQHFFITFCWIYRFTSK